MEATRGAILMLNPNNESCTLYPEEIDVLLSTGTLQIVETEKLLADLSVTMRVPKSLPKGLVEALNSAYEKLSFVEAAYVVDLRPADAQDDIKILIIILTPDMHAEHAARATITVVQGLDIDYPYPIDITVYCPSSDKTRSLSAFEPVYIKRLELRGRLNRIYAVNCAQK